MGCGNKNWRRTFLYLKYSCIQGKFKRTWTSSTKQSDNSNAKWPSEIYFLTGSDYTDFTKTSVTKDLIIEDTSSKSFDPNTYQLVTYLWTSLSQGPQCRLKYSVKSDVCKNNIEVPVSKFDEFVCYHGIRTSSLTSPVNRKDFDTLIDLNTKVNPNRPATTPRVTRMPNDSKSPRNQSSKDDEISALSGDDKSKGEKNKTLLIFGVGAVIVVGIVIIILFFVFRRNSSSKKDLERPKSEESNVE